MTSNITWWFESNNNLETAKENKMVVDTQAKLSQDILSDITVHMKYARYIGKSW